MDVIYFVVNFIHMVMFFIPKPTFWESIGLASDIHTCIVNICAPTYVIYFRQHVEYCVMHTFSTPLDDTYEEKCLQRLHQPGFQ